MREGEKRNKNKKKEEKKLMRLQRCEKRKIFCSGEGFF